MNGAWSALLAALVVAVSATVHEPEAQEALSQLKSRILAGLGMRRTPDMRLVNTTVEHMQRMTRRYYRQLRESEQELLTYPHTGFVKDNYLIFQPDVKDMSSFQSAKLRFRNSTAIDITSDVRKWKANSNDKLQVECREQQCKNAKLEISTRSSRSKRATCSKRCCRRPLKIAFKDVGWDWVIQPPDFEAFYCKGRCRPVTDDFTSTHALLQSILNFKGHKVGRPCCVPRKLRPLDLLHYNDETPPQLVVTRQKGIIVKECACS